MSRRFSFRLARVRRIRETLERVARAAWGSAEGEARTAEEARSLRRAELDQAQRHLARELSPRSGARLSPTDVLLAEQALLGQTDSLAQAHERALTRRAQADGLAEAWREREADRRALVELERRARRRHRQEQERQEAAELDEAALMRSARSRGRREDPETGSSRGPALAD